MGVNAPTDGSITHHGSEISGLDGTETAKRGIGFVPEDRRIFPELTVRENLEIAGYGGAESADLGMPVDEALDRFGQLRDRADNPGSSLSGGEQQMLAIAPALVGGADLLLLDEPTEGLAPFVVEEVLDVVGSCTTGGSPSSWSSRTSASRSTSPTGTT